MGRALVPLRLIWEFVVGEDPLMFVFVCACLGATALVEGLGVSAWWLTPVGVLGALSVSVMRARPNT